MPCREGGVFFFFVGRRNTNQIPGKKGTQDLGNGTLIKFRAKKSAKKNRQGKSREKPERTPPLLRELVGQRCQRRMIAAGEAKQGFFGPAEAHAVPAIATTVLENPLDAG
jgi:hypothetical protein